MPFELYASGRNVSRELGLGDTTLRSTHTQVAGLWQVYRTSYNGTQVFSIGIKADGTLWGVGYNAQRQIGGLPNSSYPDLIQIGSDNDWIDVAVGAQYMMALKSDGSIWVAGSNSSGQGGQGNTTSPITALTRVPGTDVWVKIAAEPGGSSSFAVRDDGKLYAWGSNGTNGSLGLGNTTSLFTTPQLVPLPAGSVVDISCGAQYTMIVFSTGHIYGWSTGTLGKRGAGGTGTFTYAIQVGSATDWARVFAGFNTTWAIKTDGTLWSTGSGDNYGSGHGDTSSRSSFTQIGTDTDWADVAPLYNGFIARKTSGALWVCGYNATGALGIGSTASPVTTLTALAFNAPDGADALSQSFAYEQSYLMIAAAPPPPPIIESPIEIEVIYPQNAPIVGPVEIAVQAAAAHLTAPLNIVVVDMSSGLVPSARWSARCLIDGIDVSARLTAQARVKFAEGGARLASLSVSVSPGVVLPLDYVGKSLVIDYVPMIAGTPVPMRIFTGRVDTVEYDFPSRTLAITGADDLQNVVAALPVDVLDHLIPGRTSVAVQGQPSDNWDYAQSRMQTVAGSLDASPSGGLRVTPWENSTPWASLGAAALVYPAIVMRYPQRHQLINDVRAVLEYRYPRLRQRNATLGWSGTLIDMRPCGYQYPTQQDILGAAGGSGWVVTHGVFYPAPAAIPQPGGGFVYPSDDAISMAILKLSQRHSQTVTERYEINVRAPDSVSENGRLPYEINAALASEFNGQAWEAALDVDPLLPDGGELDHAPDATRADAEHAIQTLLDTANVKVLGSHRSARVGATTTCNPDIDTDKHIEIDTPELQCLGKVYDGEHVLDFVAGTALTTFTLAPFSLGGTGLIAPDPLVPPASPDPQTETQDWPGQALSLAVNTFGITPYTENIMGLILNPPPSIYVEDIPGVGAQSVPNPHFVAGTYPVQGFRCQMPGVIDADRNPAERIIVTNYQIAVPVDPLQIIHP